MRSLGLVTANVTRRSVTESSTYPINLDAERLSAAMGDSSNCYRNLLSLCHTDRPLVLRYAMFAQRKHPFIGVARFPNSCYHHIVPIGPRSRGTPCSGGKKHQSTTYPFYITKTPIHLRNTLSVIRATAIPYPCYPVPRYDPSEQRKHLF